MAAQIDGDPLLAGYKVRSGKPVAASAYERAVLAFRADPLLRGFVERNYLEEDLLRAALRYARSEEFAHVCGILQQYRVLGGRVLDLGAGRGIMSLALAEKGFQVVSVECDPSEVVGIGALASFRPALALPLYLVRGNVLALPFPNASFDAAFCRSLLHHLANLEQGLREISRVLKPGGLFLACNEHIVSIFSDGRKFLDAHPAVTYGVDERAYRAWTYCRKLRKAGFRRVRFFRYPLEFSEFVRATQRNPIRARLIAVPLAGRGLARILHALHVAIRAYLSVPEERLPAISIVSQKLVHRRPQKPA